MNGAGSEGSKYVGGKLEGIALVLLTLFLCLLGFVFEPTVLV